MLFIAAKLQKTFGLCKFASNSATVVVADGAGGHEAQAVLLADVVEFDCCCHIVLLYYFSLFETKIFQRVILFET